MRRTERLRAGGITYTTLILASSTYTHAHKYTHNKNKYTHAKSGRVTNSGRGREREREGASESIQYCRRSEQDSIAARAGSDVTREVQRYERDREVRTLKRGSQNEGLLEENFFSVRLGMSLSDLWFVKNKYN